VDLDLEWPTELRYRFYRAWIVGAYGFAAVPTAAVFQFAEPLAIAIALVGFTVSASAWYVAYHALREAGRSRWRARSPRIEDLPPLAIRRLDPDDARLRRWADGAAAALVVCFVIGWAAGELYG
jgi:hypothetical protein